ncbi:glycosyltransferase [Porticoccus sp. GXU_MW_L64]
MKQPKVSVAIITYNQKCFLRDVLESVLSQKTDFLFEVVVGDDGSSDGTQDIILEYQSKYPEMIVAVLHSVNVGANQNYIDVLSRCRGRYIAHLDGDDLMLPDKLQVQCDFLDANPKFSACCHDMKVFEDGTGRFLRRYNGRVKFKEATFSSLLRNGVQFCHSSKMFRKSTIEDIKLELPTKIIFDWLMHLIHARHGVIGFIDEVLGEYRISPSSVVFSNYEKITTVCQDLLLTVDISADFGGSLHDRMYAKSRIYFESALRALELKEFQYFNRFITLSGKDGVFLSYLHRIIFHLKEIPVLISWFYLGRKLFFIWADRLRR